MNIFNALLESVLRMLIWLRYRIEIKGKESLSPQKLLKNRGVLFLPNHPAQTDALILFTLFYRKFRMRPLVVEYMYRNPLLRPFMKLTKALPIPNFDTAVNQLKLKQAKDSLGKIEEGLKTGGHFLLYPAGSLKSEGRELLKGSSAAHSLLQACPDINLILIRTTGLWGSSFSRALTGRSPDLGQMFAQGFKTILKNLVFFTPRRKVIIEIETNPTNFPRNATRQELNHYLENWYNQYPEQSEPLTLISYSIWSKQLPKTIQKKEKKESSSSSISSDTTEKIYNQIRRILENPTLVIHPTMSLSNDLGMDSLNIADLSAYLLKNYEIEDMHLLHLETVQDLLETAEGKQMISSPSSPASSLHFPLEAGRIQPGVPTGKTIVESFFNICDKMGSFTACADETTGVISYKKMKQAVLVLSHYFKTFPEERIAVMLPASIGAFITILALQAAAKVPVMLNWTLGPRYLEDMMRISGAEKIITSWRFIDRLSHVDFGNTIDKMKFLEDIRATLSLKMKLKGALQAKFSTKKILRFLHLENQSENDLCVLLFTSGTESIPKCVPLSHANILSMIKASTIALGELKSDDAVYAILPPFHSFGLGAVGLLAFLGGVKMAFYPDPTNSKALAEGIIRWKITIFPSPPSFLLRLFNAAKEVDLKSIRLYLSGAEKATADLLKRIKNLKAEFIEGYGITECSATVSMNRPGFIAKGLGKVLPHYEYCTIHPETLQVLPHEAEGEICLTGPSIFKGYLGSSHSPFIEIDGKSWYRTGDLGRIEKDGTLFLSGRLKRFAKVGGEMISLGAIEETLAKELLNRGQIKADIHSLAVCCDEAIPDKSRLVLFTITNIEKETVNEILKTAGFSNLVKISLVKKVGEIPLLATGKMDYRKLLEQV